VSRFHPPTSLNPSHSTKTPDDEVLSANARSISEKVENANVVPPMTRKKCRLVKLLTC
jgi:hypothetical protein